MSLTDEDIRSLVMRWTMRAEPRAEEHLAREFVYTSEMEVHGRDDFVRGMHAQAPWRDVRVLGVVVGRTQAATFFEGTDPVTNLAHRVAWLLDHQDGQVKRLTAVHSVIAP